MTGLRRAACIALAAAALLASPAYPTAFSVDQSDLYYIALESGWGIQLVQRGSVIFATMFVYGQSGTPTWYVATLDPTGAALTWSGDLYATTGPYFAMVPFNPANVTATKVGTMTWVAQTTATGTLNYDVNGTAVTKNVTRQTLVFDDYSGTYSGTLHAGATGCTNSANNSPPTDVPFVTISVTQSDQTVTLSLSLLGAINLTISGTLSQSGQFGYVAGPYTSTVGEVGNATVSELNVQTNSLAGTVSFNSTNNGCHTNGYFAAVRSTP
ncbi:MAG TPA: hypothetical protein VF420_07850 [Casimicrobiaceae bacterium]